MGGGEEGGWEGGREVELAGRTFSSAKEINKTCTINANVFLSKSMHRTNVFQYIHV